MNDIKIGLQYLMPKYLLTRLAGFFAASRLGFVTRFAVKGFIKAYNIDMTDAKHSSPIYYQTFNDFFTRELKTDARPIVEGDDILSYPADARVSQFGKIKDGQLIQAKGHYFSALALLGGDDKLAEEFKDGSFSTLYLSPKDYHRVHMPCDGTLRKMIYVPGDLFSVNKLTAKNVPDLFARNERVISVFDTPFGTMAQILVGATIVGSIEQIWAGTVNEHRKAEITTWHYPIDDENAVVLKKGEEMGRFKLGSTVINLFVKNAVTFDDSVKIDKSTVMGTAYAHKK